LLIKFWHTQFLSIKVENEAGNIQYTS